MTAAVTELYDALRKAGVDETSALAAAKAVTASDLKDLVTKADLQTSIAEIETRMAQMQTDIIKWNVGTILAMTGIFAAIVKIF